MLPTNAMPVAADCSSPFSQASGCDRLLLLVPGNPTRDATRIATVAIATTDATPCYSLFQTLCSRSASLQLVSLFIVLPDQDN